MSEARTPPQLLIERMALGELDAPTERALRDEFGDGLIDEALAALVRSDAVLRQEFAASDPLARIQSRVVHNQAQSRGALVRRLTWAAPPALAAAAALVFALSPDAVPRPDGAVAVTRSHTEAGEELEATRIKGDSPIAASGDRADPGAQAQAVELLVYRRVEAEGEPTEASIEQLRDGSEVRKGDVLQVGYECEAPFGVVLSLDGRGEVTLHHPTRADDGPRLARKKALLGFSYELDDSPAFERFFFVTSDKTFDIASVLAAASKLGRNRVLAGQPSSKLPVESGLHVTSIMLRKVK